MAIEPSADHQALLCGAVPSTAAAAAVPHTSSAALDSPGTPSYMAAHYAAAPCRPSPFLADSQAQRAGDGLHGLSAACSGRRGTWASAAASQADEQSSSVLDWLSGWARLAVETEAQGVGSEPGSWEDLPPLPCRQRSWAGFDVRASAQRRTMSVAAPGPAMHAHPTRKRSRSCMVAPLPTAAALLASQTGCQPKRCHRIQDAMFMLS